jgi:hypothetical protein
MILCLGLLVQEPIAPLGCGLGEVGQKATVNMINETRNGIMQMIAKQKFKSK